MVAKKKKSLATRLAKMSDEERARYLQHKADMEEEARRRKEQLIAIFMKNKIKKEEAFSRLNLAKINQHWHNILRRMKCKEMKENVEYLKEWIERMINLKNKSIEKLLFEMEQAEDQYCHNFQYHLTQVDKTIASHQHYMTKLRYAYEEDRHILLDTMRREEETYLENINKEEEHLQMIMYGLDEKTGKEMLRDKKEFEDKYDDIVSSCRIEFDAMRQAREVQVSALWKEIAEVFNAHIQRTDNKRMHLAELKRLDAESAQEIHRNQGRISQAEQEIELLNKQLTLAVEERDETLRKLDEKHRNESRDCLRVKKRLQSEIIKDEKQFCCLTTSSSKCLDKLSSIAQKGSKILSLVEICKKLETEEEKVLKWIPLQDSFEEDYSPDETSPKEVEVTVDEYPKSISVISKIDLRKRRIRPKSSVVLLSDMAPKKEAENPLPESKKHRLLEETFDALSNLEGLWWVVSRVQVNCMDLKIEKAFLLKENEELKEKMRSILEKEAMEPSISSYKGTYGKNLKFRVVSAPGYGLGRA